MEHVWFPNDRDSSGYRVTAGRERFEQPDGWGGKLFGEQDSNFVYRCGLTFPKAMACGNYRAPHEAPYSYGPHIISGPKKVFKGKVYSADYDDRLRSWVSDKKWKEAVALLGGERLKHASLAKVSAFLSHLRECPLECVQLVEGCNVSNGYPYLIFISRKVSS